MPDIGDLERQIRITRERQFRQLAREYRPVAERLAEAYQRSIPGIEDAIKKLPDLLNPQYPSVVTAADQEVIEAFLKRTASDLDSLRRALDDTLPGLQNGAVEAGVRGGIANLNAGGMGVQFGRPLLEGIQAAVDYVDSPVFQLKLRELSAYHSDKIRDLLLIGQATGTNPRQTARLIAEYFTSRRPLIDADNWARTTQMYAYRQGTRRVYERNGVREWIWSAALDDRTCMACIAMHGTRHPVTEVLNDHHRGRCAMVPVTPTWAELGFSDGQEPQYQTGVDWFNNLSDERKARIMGPQLYEGWKAGLFDFNPQTVVGTYQNDVFGEMRRRRTNQEILAGILQPGF